ncbi:pilus assembly protein PilX [Ideonella sp. BN130291]|uniref:pilus assembly protein PilX n=1 Tax=Ideonella sp. BN130291 TaxID=3112940 RepID=UPI002E25CE5B|nr:pilus assembly protein PilX [Ideonella sp. BN130291]
MLFALIALVVLLLGGAALVRTVDSGQLALGNLAFKQDATIASAQGADAAIVWIQANSAGVTLHADGAAGTGYYASSKDKLDPTGTATAKDRALIDWEGDGNCGGADPATFSTCNVVPSPAIKDAKTGNEVRFVITRLCAAEGDPAAVDCSRPAKSSGGNSMDRGAISQGKNNHWAAGGSGPYYRVITRTKGARDTVSFTETLVHF